MATNVAMGGKRDKKKKAKDPLKKAALAAKRDAKADRVALRRLHREGGGSAEDASEDDDEKSHRRRGAGDGDGDEDWDAILESRRRRTGGLTAAELSPIEDPFPRPPRGNFTWTLCPSNGMLYMVSFDHTQVPFRPDESTAR